MTLIAWTVMMVLAFVSLAWARNRFQLSTYYVALAALAGGLLIAEEQFLALTNYFMHFSMALFLAAFVATCGLLAFVVREVHRSELDSVFEPVMNEPEMELEAQPAV